MNLEDVLLIGTRAAQPLATDVAAGMLYSVTDEGNLVEQSRGGVWITYAGSGGSSSFFTSGGGIPFPLSVDGEDGLDGFSGSAGIQGPIGLTGAPGSGGSGGMTPIVFKPADNEPPTANFATIDLRNSHPVLDFDGVTDESAIFTGFLPAGYAGGGLTVITFWSFTSATTGSLRVEAEIERIDLSSLDINANSFATGVSAGGSAPATSGMVIAVSLVFTSGAVMDSLVASELFRLRIRRDANGTTGTDDITTDAELLAVVVIET